MGPIARILIRREGARAASEDELIDALTRHIPSVPGRTRFSAALRAFQSQFGSGTRPPRTPPVSGSGAEQEATQAAVATPLPFALDAVHSGQCEKLLAGYVGPMARILVKRAAAQARSAQQFYTLLAENIRDEAARRRFLRDVGAG